MSHPILETLFFLRVARQSLCESIVDLNTDNESELINYVQNEASDYEVMQLLVLGEISDSKYNIQEEERLWTVFKEAVIFNSASLLENMFKEDLMNIVYEMGPVSHLGYSSAAPILEFAKVQGRLTESYLNEFEWPKLPSFKANKKAPKTDATANWNKRGQYKAPVKGVSYRERNAQGKTSAKELRGASGGKDYSNKELDSKSLRRASGGNEYDRKENSGQEVRRASGGSNKETPYGELRRTSGGKSTKDTMGKETGSREVRRGSGGGVQKPVNTITTADKDRLKRTSGLNPDGSQVSSSPKGMGTATKVAGGALAAAGLYGLYKAYKSWKAKKAAAKTAEAKALAAKKVKEIGTKIASKKKKK